MTVSSRPFGGRGGGQLDDELIRSSDLSQITVQPRRPGDDFGVLGVGLALPGERLGHSVDHRAGHVDHLVWRQPAMPAATPAPAEVMSVAQRTSVAVRPTCEITFSIAVSLLGT
jgi:hypothetical protein